MHKQSVCVFAHVHAYMCTCESQELGGVPQESSSLFSQTLPLTWNQQTDEAWLTGQCAQVSSSCLCKQNLDFVCGFEGPNKGPHASAANTLPPTEPSPQIKQILSEVHWKLSHT